MTRAEKFLEEKGINHDPLVDNDDSLVICRLSGLLTSYAESLIPSEEEIRKACTAELYQDMDGFDIGVNWLIQKIKE